MGEVTDERLRIIWQVLDRGAPGHAPTKEEQLAIVTELRNLRSTLRTAWDAHQQGDAAGAKHYMLEAIYAVTP